MQVGRTHENRIGFFGFGHELVTATKGNLAVFRDVVDGFDIAHGNLLLIIEPVCRIQRKPSIPKAMATRRFPGRFKVRITTMIMCRV